MLHELHLYGQGSKLHLPGWHVPRWPPHSYQLHLSSLACSARLGVMIRTHYLKSVHEKKRKLVLAPVDEGTFRFRDVFYVVVESHALWFRHMPF